MVDESFEARVQRIAEAHLNACSEWLFDDRDELPSPAFGPYDGCDTCVVREVLMSVWDEFLAEARREVQREADEQEEWFVPGGAMIDRETSHTIRLRPPRGWRKVEVEIPRVPPSMNTNEVRAHWRGFHEHKKSWQEEIEQLLMVQRVQRLGYQRAMVGGFLRFPKRVSRRDPGNFAGLLNKACGDALVTYGAIPDDDAPHYFFGGVEIEPEPGPARTRLWVFLQPKEEG